MRIPAPDRHRHRNLAAITKMVGSWRHLKMGTVNLELVKWLSSGSVPAATIWRVTCISSKSAPPASR